MRGISIIICSLNGAKRIPDTLRAVSRCRADFPVEVILIDNNSSDGTDQVARDVWRQEGNAAFSFSVVSETLPGSFHARARGIREATKEYVLFCDDDNRLDANYLVTAVEILDANPQIGMLGGRSIGAFESEPPAWFLDNSSMFAIGDQGSYEGDITDERGWVWGAGCVIRASALRELDEADITPIASGHRIGWRMTGGEDIELPLYLVLLGWRIWNSPRLVLEHYMPTARFNRQRLRRLMFHNGMIFSAIRYPLMSEGGRPGITLWVIQKFLSRRWKRMASPGALLEFFYLLGQLNALALESSKIQTVRANKQKLLRARARKQAEHGRDVAAG